MIIGTFSEIPNWTRSESRECRVRAPEDVGSGAKPLTGIGLDPRCHFTGSHVVEKGDILAKDGLKVALANAFCVDLASVDPDVHV